MRYLTASTKILCRTGRLLSPSSSIIKKSGDRKVKLFSQVYVEKETEA